MIVAFRHGRFPLNVRSNLTGEAAFRAAEEMIPPDADATMDLLPEGRKQAERIRERLAAIAIDACLRSPALRTKTTAEIVLAGRNLPGGTWVVPELRERSRGIFSYAPDDWAHTHPLYPAGKSVLDWEPFGVDYNGNSGESIRQVANTRVEPVLFVADQVAPGGNVAFSTHAEWMLALRTYFLNFDDERFRRPLIPNPAAGIIALATAKMIVNGQVDMYDCTRLPYEPSEAPSWHMDKFRSIGVDPVFDTGWLDISEMRAQFR
jgi:broad specificity phosphatase PhoE